MGKKDPNFGVQGKRGGMGGTYGSKSTNLSKKTLKAAGAAKAAKKRTVSVSQTRRDEGKGRTLGPKGKPLTGTVTLQDGSKAVYKNGRRVQAADAKKPKAASTRSSSPKGSGSSPKGTSPAKNPNAGVKVGTVRKGAAGNRYNRWDGKKWVPVAAARTGSGSGQPGQTAPAKASSPMDRWNAMSPAQKKAYSGNVQRWAKAMGINLTQAAAKVVGGGKNSLLGKTAAAAAPSGSTGKGVGAFGGPNANRRPSKPETHKVGDKKTTMSGVAVWDGKKWVKSK